MKPRRGSTKGTPSYTSEEVIPLITNTPTFDNARGPAVRTLRSAWNREGAVQVSCALPRWSEEPLTQRSFRLWPPGHGSGEDLLRNWDVSAVCTKGKKGQHDATIGQDNFSVSKLPEGWEVYVVCDGHGHDAHWPAQRVVTVLPYILQCQACADLLRQGRVEDALRQAFVDAQADLQGESERHGINLAFAGCTVLCMLYDPEAQKVWVAHAGDSRALLISPGEGVIHQSADHKPCVPEERARVVASGGEVRVADGEVHHDAPERVYMVGRNYPALALSRCLGDLVAHTCGVICDPDIVQWDVSKHPRAMLLAATDGIWEFIDSQSASSKIFNALQSGASQQEALQSLVEHAQKLWADEDPAYCDDICALLIPLRKLMPRPRPTREVGCAGNLRRLLPSLFE